MSDARELLLADDKRAMRARMLARLRVIASDPDVRAARSTVLTERLIAAVAERAPGAGVVAVYEPFTTEVVLQPFVDWCVTGGRTTVWPHVDTIDGTSTMRMRTADGEVVAAERLDVVVVPGLAFTADGERLGRGGGFYDRLLAVLRPDCLTVAVAFAEQLVDAVPTEPHDHPVALVLTDDGLSEY